MASQKAADTLCLGPIEKCLAARPLLLQDEKSLKATIVSITSCTMDNYSSACASAKELGDEALFKHIAHLQVASAVLLASAELKLHMVTQGNKLETCAQAVELITIARHAKAARPGLNWCAPPVAAPKDCWTAASS